MFYGRIDVYWPDGPIESYRLNKPTVAVGRSSGNDIVLDTTSISRYHITFAFKNQQILLEDLKSVNGTYVDGVRLEPHEPYVLRGGEEVQIGDIRLIFHPPTETADSADEEDTTERITLSQPTYRLSLEGAELVVAPGAHVQATLKIENLGDQADRYFIEIDGLPKGWARLDRVEMEVEPGEQGQATISFKPLRRSETQPGGHAFIVRVRSKSRPAETVDVPKVLQVLPFNGFGMALNAPRLDGDNNFKLYVHNQGNAVLPLVLKGTDPAQVLRIRLPKTQVQLGPGERQTLIGSVEPRRRRMFGQAHPYEFAVLAQAQDPSGFLASVPGTYVETGLLPAWAPVLAVPVIALVVLSLVGLLLLLVGGGDDGKQVLAQPVITQFTVANPSISLGEVAALTWEVEHAESIEVVAEKDGIQQRFSMESSTTSYTLPFDQTGRYTLTLEARSGQNIVMATAAVEVRPVVSLGLGLLGADELTRNVEHTVRVTWDVSGAREFDGAYSIWVESSDRVEPLVVAPLPLSGSHEVQVVLPEDQIEWLVVLYAEGQDNVVASVTQKLAVTNPTCELSAPSTVVRSGPGESYPALVPPLERSAEGSVPLSPIARAPDGLWMQVMIGIDNPRLGWVLREDFVCTNFDPDRLVVTTEFPPLPQVMPVTPTP